MKIKDLLNQVEDKYKEQAKMILADLYNKNKLEIITMKDIDIDNNVLKIFQEKIELLRSGKPIQYVIGNVNFCGLKIKVNENVLIPRFETEELVENTINYIKKFFDNDSIKILDLCTGSGAIGLAIKKKYPNIDVTLSDISEEALEIAKYNSENLNLKVKIIKSNLLDDIKDKYDIIISNPPYIKDNEKIEEIVKNNEPHLALYAGHDGLDCYRKILKNISKNLNHKYLIAFEIGYDQKDKVMNLASDNLIDVTSICIKDLSGNDRMIFISNIEDAFN